MKPTPEMIEAGLKAQQGSDVYLLYRDDPEALKSMEDNVAAILAAALSVPAAAVVGEPVAWTTETNLIVAKHDLELALTMWGRPTGKEPVALYREPVAAPSAPDGEPECEFGVPDPKFRVGQLVEKASGYKWPGVVVSRFLTQSLQIRYVVECTVPEVAGALHIYSESQLVALGGASHE